MRKIIVNFSVKLFFFARKQFTFPWIPILQNEFYCEYFEK